MDDHPLYREGFVTALSMLDGVDVVAEAGDGVEAVELALEPGAGRRGHGPQPARSRRYRGDPPDHGAAARHGVLVLTMLEGDDALFAAMRAGARGYLLKGADRQEIARALETVANGEVVFSATLASRVLAWFARGGAARGQSLPRAHRAGAGDPRLVARGLTNAAIARRLVVSDKTVRNHVSNVFGKLHVADRAEAVARARDAGMGAGPL